MAQEIMLVNSAIANLIRESKTAQIYSMIQTGSQIGMQTLDGHLKQLVLERKVAPEDAMIKCQRPEEFKRLAGITSDINFEDNN